MLVTYVTLTNCKLCGLLEAAMDYRNMPTKKVAYRVYVKNECDECYLKHNSRGRFLNAIH